MRAASVLTALALFLTTIWAATDAGAQDPFIYPAQGQSQEQLEKDKFECYSWAKQSAGFDPMAQPTASAPPPAQEAPKGGLLRGAARGAATGLVVGAIAGDAGKGAAIGAAGGGLVGGMRRRDQGRQQQHAEEQWAQQQAAEYHSKRNAYNRAFGACLEGRGYTVK